MTCGPYREVLIENAIDAIMTAYATLKKERDLSPNNLNINYVLYNLVRALNLCQKAKISKSILQNPDLQTIKETLPEFCGMAESEMEKYWARKFIAQNEVDLEAFVFYKQYNELLTAEMELVGSRRYRKMSFLGSGALPLTAIILAFNNPDVNISCVDFEPEVVELSQKLVKKLGLSKQINILCMDAQDYVPEDGELVIFASLLEGAQKIYDSYSTYNNDIVVRDSEECYQFLYKQASLPSKGFREVSKTLVDPNRVNTSRFFVRDDKY